MRNSVIEEFARKTIQEVLASPQVERQIRETLQNELVSRENLPLRGDIAVIPHPPSANYAPGHPLHAHDYFELIYVYEGSAIQHLEHDRLVLDKGSILLMNMKARHGLSSDLDSIVFNILISKSLLNSSFLVLLRDNSALSEFFVDSLFSRSQAGAYIFFRSNPDSHAEYLIQMILEEYILQKPGFSSAMQSYLSLLFTELYRCHLYETNRESKELINYAELMSYVNEHLENITLNSLAERFHYSPVYLSNTMKRFFGQSFSSVVNELRLRKAAEYLANTTMSVNAIVELLGYYDRSYFNRVFRKKYGLSPGDYRDQIHAG